MGVRRTHPEHDLERSRIYFYKLTADTGGAPCVRDGLLSLAICKPMIRSTASKGDLIFGFAANSLDPDKRLIYVARITDKLCTGLYYKSNQYVQRGDCIYRFKDGRFEWKNGSRYHGPKDIVHDLGSFPDYPRANVLLSTDFRYFGQTGSDDYKDRSPEVWRAVERLGRGQRVHHRDVLRDQLRRMKDWIWDSTRNKKLGNPTDKPSRRTCHRGRSCGVV
jgi:hypothetical protein